VGFLVFICTLALVAVVVLVLSAPIRAARARAARPTPLYSERSPQNASLRSDELQAARESKYREIRDAELDFRTGKLSREDYERVDAELRAEALTILDALEALDAGSTAEEAPTPGESPD
jgi:hypothetical protein